MVKILQYFSIILLLISISVECHNFDKFKKNLISVKNLDIFYGINEILFGNWTQDRQCLTELNAIKNGLKNSEEWAFKGKLIVRESISILNIKCHFMGIFQSLMHGVNFRRGFSITIFSIRDHFRNVFISNEMEKAIKHSIASDNWFSRLQSKEKLRKCKKLLLICHFDND